MEKKKYNPKTLATLRFMFANSLYNQKINQNTSNRLRFKFKHLVQISMFVLYVYLLVNFGAVDWIDSELWQNIIFIILGAMSSMGVIITMIRHWGQFDSKSIRHENTAKQYRKVRDDLLLLITDYMSGMISESEVIQKRDSIKREMDIIDQNALSTEEDDYKKAQKDLRGETCKGEHFTFSDEEIDKHLPKELWITQRDVVLPSEKIDKKGEK